MSQSCHQTGLWCSCRYAASDRRAILAPLTKEAVWCNFTTSTLRLGRGRAPASWRARRRRLVPAYQVGTVCAPTVRLGCAANAAPLREHLKT